MQQSKSYSFSLKSEIFDRFKTICDECNINKSKYLEKMIDFFNKSIDNGNFDAIDEMKNISKRLKKLETK